MPPIEYLLSAEPWTVYRTLLDLLDLPADDPRVTHARERMLAHPLVRGLMEEVKGWPGTVLNSHKSAGQLYHKLRFLAELGISAGDGGMAETLEKVRSHRSGEGLFLLPANIPEHFGGSGRDIWAWALCDAPLLLYASARIGGTPYEGIRPGVEYLSGLVRDNGWPCAVSRELGKFRGPGRKNDPCPYATLIMLKLLLLYPETRDSGAARAGAECLLRLWERSREEHPYMFYMGTDFRKLKAPFIWYDIIHVADALSEHGPARADARFADMLGVIRAKAGPGGLYAPESEWKAWSGWDFAQKKKPSPWLTFLVCRIEKRAGARPER